MCTAITYQSSDHYFGRNLDLERTYRERVTITPRNYPFSFRRAGTLSNHYAMIGMATVEQDYPLYYEATNEMGLSMAGLNFPGLAVYYQEVLDQDNISPFELIPWVLCQCKNMDEANALLNRLNIVNIPFSHEYPLSPLHWIIADREKAITLECMADGMRIYENPVGVLTNNPPFDYHMYHLADFMQVSKHPPVNLFSESVEIKPYSLGMGSMGLPGDLSSSSRFVKAAFTKLNSLSGSSESESVSQFFHILGSVAQQRGCCRVQEDEYEYTLYSSCCNTDKGIYYYTTYNNSQISGVDMHKEDLESDTLITYELIKKTQIRMQN